MRSRLGIMMLILAACASGAGDTTYLDAPALYVSPSGDDAATGLTAEDPLRSIAHAASLAGPDTEIRILPGTFREGVFLEGIGFEDAAIHITGFEGVPVLDGGDSEPLGIFCDGCINLEVSNLEIANYTDIGIGATNSAGIVFRDLHVHHNGAAVQLIDWELEGYGIHVDDSTEVLIEGNDVHDNGPDPPVLWERILGTGIDTFNLRDAVIRNNRSFRNHGGGILVEDSVNVLVEGNEVFENDLDATIDQWWDGGLWLDGGRDVVVRDNFFHDNLGPGIEISDEEDAGPTGYLLEGNVSSGNYFGIYVWNFGTDDWPDAIELSGNDFTGNERRDVWIVPSA